MTTRDWMFSAIEALLWYLFFYQFIYAIRSEHSIFISALLLVVLMYAAGMSCPLVRHSSAWRRMWEE